MWVCVVTPSVGALRPFSEGLYIGGVAELFGQLFGLVGGSALSFWGALGERKRGETGSLFELLAIQDLLFL